MKEYDETDNNGNERQKKPDFNPVKMTVKSVPVSGKKRPSKPAPEKTGLYFS